MTWGKVAQVSVYDSERKSVKRASVTRVYRRVTWTYKQDGTEPFVFNYTDYNVCPSLAVHEDGITQNSNESCAISKTNTSKNVGRW